MCKSAKTLDKLVSLALKAVMMLMTSGNDDRWVSNEEEWKPKCEVGMLNRKAEMLLNLPCNEWTQ